MNFDFVRKCLSVRGLLLPGSVRVSGGKLYRRLHGLGVPGGLLWSAAVGSRETEAGREGLVPFCVHAPLVTARRPDFGNMGGMGIMAQACRDRQPIPIAN